MSYLTEQIPTLPTKVCLVKAMVFSVVMYRCEIWTIKKAEHQRPDAFVFFFFLDLMLLNWIADSKSARKSLLTRSNQSIVKEIN